MDTFYPKNRKEWNEWLTKNHRSANEIWVVYYKKHTKKPTVPYHASLEEAICFGWIDGLIKRVDDEKYVRRFGPRKPGSLWSKVNREIAEKLLADNKVSPYGLEKINEAKHSGRWDAAYDMQTRAEIPKDLEAALKNKPTAWKNFNALTQSYQARYIFYINMAKRKATREKRIKMVAENAEKNIKPGMS